MKKKIRKIRKTKTSLEALRSPRRRNVDAGIVFSLRLTGVELDQLRESAEQEHLTVSDLIRRRVFQPNVANVFSIPETRSINDNVVSEPRNFKTQNSAHF